MAFNAPLARKQRRWLELSQEDVAKCLGVGRRTVARWEAGDQQPRADELQQLARILRLPITDLVPEAAGMDGGGQVGMAEVAATSPAATPPSQSQRSA